MIKIRLSSIIADSLIESAYDINNKAVMLIGILDLIGTLFCIFKGYDLFTVLLVDFAITFIVAAVFSIVQTRSTIKRIIKDNAVESTMRLFKEEMR